MTPSDTWPFILAAVALLGSPGPAIAALLAVGRVDGWTGGLRFYAGLQIGLATAAGISIAGLFAAVSTFPAALLAMSLIATVYLLYLAYKIATAPVGKKDGNGSQSSSLLAGLLLGVTNPKAYLAFASLFASFLLVEADVTADSVAKWSIVVAVMIVVDLAWLWIGVRLGRLNLSDRAERRVNVTLAGTIVLASALALT